MSITTAELKAFTSEELLAILQVADAVQDRKEEDALARLLETAILYEGKKGRGKTLTAVAQSYQLRERFGRHVIAVGSKMGLKPEFGEFQNLDEREFKNALDTIAEVAEDKDSEKKGAEEVHKALLSRGVDLLYSTIVFDEAYRLFDASHRDRLSRLFGYFVSQSRHYHCTIILLTPNRKMVDQRVTQQIDWWGRVFHNKWTDKCEVILTAGLETMTFSIDGADGTYHTPYYEMYNSWALLGFRKSHLTIEKY
jgi:hypothetical protein